MMNKRVLRTVCLLSTALIAVIFAASCELPLPSPREAHVGGQTSTPSEKPVSELTSEPIDVVDSTSEAPAVVAASVSDAATDPPVSALTNTPVILVLPTDPPDGLEAALPTVPDPAATATRSPSSSVQLSTTVPTTPTYEAILTDEPSARAIASTAEAEIATALPDSPSSTQTQTEETGPSSPVTDTATISGALTTNNADVPVEPASFTPDIGDVLLHGDFERGFNEIGVGTEWQGFDNVDGVYGWSDETWPGLVQEGEHAQMMRITSSSEPDQFVGIMQTVPVEKGEPYELTIHGLLRSTEGSAEASNWGYRLEWGVDTRGRDSWKYVDEWHDAGWDDQPLDGESFAMLEHNATITPPDDTLTLFVRGRRKWETQGREVEFILDGVSLVGPIPGGGAPSKLPNTGAPSTTWLFAMVAALLAASFILIMRHLRKV